jgi:hypothetical protein
VTPSPTPDAPTPVEEVATPTVIEEPAPPPQGVQPHAPLNLKFGPDVVVPPPSTPTPEAPALEESAPELPPVPPEERAQITEKVNKRKEEIAKEEGIKSAATLNESQNFGQSTTPFGKQGVNLRETRRAKARALRKANDKEESDTVRLPLDYKGFGGRKRRNGNRWTHRRKH